MEERKADVQLPPSAKSNYICAKCADSLGEAKQEAPKDSSTACCFICLGLWQDQESFKKAMEKACEPYGGMKVNRFSMQQPPSVAIPGDVALRYTLAARDKRQATSREKYLKRLKDHVKNVALNLVKQKQRERLQDYPSCVETEEQGFLCVHVIIHPVVEVSRPDGIVLPGRKKIRKRFRGSDPTEKQGGDPRQNLERRFAAEQDRALWSCTDVQAVLEQTDTLPQGWIDWFLQHGEVHKGALDYHVAVWRRPYFVRALYTKSRRDVSQSPFYVPSLNKGKAMVRKGITSVEEEIASALKEVCGELSTGNNDMSSSIVYSMIKFHASGREDMDVRMLLPPEPTPNVGGRPFVCQVIDALDMPTMEQLAQVVRTVNCATKIGSESADNDSELRGRTYGCNPKGVGISDCFTFVPSHSFKNLQADTENKVKYYGCLCWSKREFSSESELMACLGTFPLEIQQKTPIRVLHRRSNAIRSRRVLTLKATRVDDHYFRLNQSTEAGTYVKEFVHGDLGRTVPSVSSLLGCKTDILELDCEGIAGV